MDYRQQLVSYWLDCWCDFSASDVPSDYMIDRVCGSVELLDDEEVLDLLSV